MQMRDSSYPHIKWLELHDDGVMTECAVMKIDKTNNDVFFFPLSALDDIDKRRLVEIVTSRNATMFELWDLMKNITLKNGVNALSYFHQLVKVRTSGGKIIDLTSGQRGVVMERKVAPTNAPAPAVAPKTGRKSTKKA